VGELGRFIDSGSTVEGGENRLTAFYQGHNQFAGEDVLSVCCARLAVAWGRLLTAPKAASKSVLKQARETEAAVARVGGIIKDAQEGSASKGYASQSPPQWLHYVADALASAQRRREERGSLAKPRSRVSSRRAQASCTLQPGSSLGCTHCARAFTAAVSGTKF
jgi:hypothetical protein